jgi:lysophospholipase L1-like esterase
MATKAEKEVAIDQLRKYAKFKQRSFQTTTAVHLPLLARASPPPAAVLLGASIIERMPTTAQSQSGAVLLGDSMMERMTTTGRSRSFAPWPSPTLMDDQTAEALSIQRRSDVFNAGVGRDRFENIIFRLTGSYDPAHSLQGLISALDLDSIKLWVIQAGTNNLHPRRGLREKDLDMLRLMLETLLRVSAQQTKLLLTGLFYRKDVDDGRIDEANREYEGMVDDLNQDFDGGRVEFLAAPRDVDKNSHLVDHVHLNEAGYRVWAKVLVPKVMDMLRS